MLAGWVPRSVAPTGPPALRLLARFGYHFLSLVVIVVLLSRWGSRPPRPWSMPRSSRSRCRSAIAKPADAPATVPGPVDGCDQRAARRGGLRRGRRGDSDHHEDRARGTGGLAAVALGPALSSDPTAFLALTVVFAAVALCLPGWPYP